MLQIIHFCKSGTRGETILICCIGKAGNSWSEGLVINILRPFYVLDATFSILCARRRAERNSTDRALRLGEKDLNYHPNRPTPRDIFQWRLELPKKMKVKCTGGIAKLNVDSFDGSISVTTAAGRMKFKRSKGMFDISSAASNIEFDQCEGTFKIRTGGSADIRASRTVIEGESLFSTSGGNVFVSLARTPRHNITISTGKGAGVLDYNGNPVVGSFKFSSEKDKGRISSPYSFEKQETYPGPLKNIRNQNDFGKKVDYLLKTQVVGNPSPEIFIKTIWGSAVLRN